MAHTPETRKRAYQKIRARRAGWLLENGPCRICKSAVRLEIHHMDPAEKVSHSVWSWSNERRVAELEKCIVLCSKCHDDIHRPEPICGLSGYARGCRCAVCTAAVRESVYQSRLRRWGSISSKPKK